MPRRIPDYPDAYAGWNYVASIGSLISLMSVAILIWVFFTMCYHNPNKPNLKNNVWQIGAYFTLGYNFFVDFFYNSNEDNLRLKSKTNYSSLEFSINTPADYHSFTQAPIMGDLGGVQQLFTSVVDATAKSNLNFVCLALDLDLLNLVKWNYNYYNPFTIGGAINTLYEYYYRFLCSLFPKFISPLPGQPLMKLDKLFFFILKNYLIYSVISRVIYLVYVLIKLISFIILFSFPNFTIKYLFYFNKNAQIVWSPILSYLNSGNIHHKVFEAYRQLRRDRIANHIGVMLKTIVSGFIRWVVVVILNYHGL